MTDPDPTTHEASSDLREQLATAILGVILQSDAQPNSGELALEIADAVLALVEPMLAARDQAVLFHTAETLRVQQLQVIEAIRNLSPEDLAELIGGSVEHIYRGPFTDPVRCLRAVGPWQETP